MLKDLQACYRKEGVEGVRRQAGAKRFEPFLVRVADEQNNTLFFRLTDPEEHGAVQALEKEIQPDWSILPLSDTEVLVATMYSHDGAILQTGRSSRRQQLFLDHFRHECAVILLLIFVLSVGGGAFLAYRALEPLYRVTDTAIAIIKTGNVSARLQEVPHAGELRELVFWFNRMLDRIESLIRDMRDAIDNVAHDLRTPLTRLRGIAEVALRKPADTALAREALADCVEEADRIITLLNTLMDISEIETGTMRLVLQPTDFPALVRQAAEIYSETAEEKGVALKIEVGPGFVAQIDANRMRQAVANVIDNAIKYTPEGGCVRVTARECDGDAICVVDDTGPGIPPEEIDRIWTRLYRGDASRSQRGLGLGLSLVAATVSMHRGKAEVFSEPEHGARFTLRVPCASNELSKV